MGALALVASISAASTGCLDRPLAELEPRTTNLLVTQLKRDAPDKIDLLFMIDNSLSMADKQSMLAAAVPALVKRLVSPRCVDPSTNAPVGGQYPCSVGKAEFRPIDDIHVGVITSSLGGHGGKVCSADWKNWNPTQNDAAHLVGERRGLAADGLGFLSWDPDNGQGDAESFVQSFATHVKAAGEKGCGYEAQLEAWYRFLVDPEPPASIEVKDGVVVAEGIDQVLLQQRAEFLRPDSLLAIVMLSDENDCSIADSGQAWLVADDNGPMPRSAAVCQSNPSDACCRSCASSESEPPAGCMPLSQDPGCTPLLHASSADDVNLRCWDQKRRFGVDFLQPIGRYVDALTKPRIVNRRGEEVANPLFSDLKGGGAPMRDPSFVYLAGIVGVPWQDVATNESLTDPSLLQYLPPREIAKQGRWPWLVPTAGAAPLDPLMIESTLPRTGENPATGIALVGPDGTTAHPVNGHEWYPDGRDLQYACIYPLTAPRDCASVAADQGCDCRTLVPGEKNPLCQNPTTGEYGNVQYFAKAYPATRQLQVVQGAGDHGIVASICPKNTANAQAASYGYNPAVDAIVDRLKEQLTTRCMPRPLEVTPEGKAQCAIVEATRGACQCDATSNRSAPGAALSAAVLAQLAAAGQCGPTSPGGTACEELCLCELGTATDLASCQNELEPNGTGWCYVDPALGLGNPALVSECDAAERRLVRFIGDDTPTAGASVYVACLGAPLGS